ncbi:hypothetical protein K402DRAFT_419878 [Aulographum hederae CBS 113979]|uniref:Uncharacterized protein n=1 Tax=Aulographum hederae CBS 113979 TaxID=1176131 RepID=A0A6G1H4Z3_9PEZI|nr:hypothetical protein K402DRAFT_419878 [Aulographum hederae CBS 113979]
MRTRPHSYSHYFNVKISGNGSATPEGIKFPGRETTWDHHVVAGPTKYQVRYDAPSGSVPTVSIKERGQFPDDFRIK